MKAEKVVSVIIAAILAVFYSAIVVAKAEGSTHTASRTTEPATLVPFNP